MDQIDPQSSVCGQWQIVELPRGLAFPLWRRIRCALTLVKTENIVFTGRGMDHDSHSTL